MGAFYIRILAKLGFLAVKRLIKQHSPKRRGQIMKGEILDRIVSFGLLVDRIVEVATNAKDTVRKVEDMVSGNTSKAKKSSTDELYFNSVIRKMRSMSDPGKENARKVRTLEDQLREDTTRPGAGEAFVLFIAQAVDRFSVTKKPRQQQQKNKGKNDADNTPQEEFSFRDISAGVEWAIAFIEELLEHETYEKQVKFLEGRNVFSLISNPSALKLVIDKAKELGKDGLEKSKELVKDVCEKVVEHHATNKSDLDKSSQSGIERAREFRDRMRGNRS